MKFDRSAAADLWRNTLSQIPTTFGRLIYLASLRDQNTGTYQHHGLAQLFGPDEADQTLRQSHTQTFSEWLCFNLEQQKDDLEGYLDELQEDTKTILATWLRLTPYRNFMPAHAREVERNLFTNGLELLARRPRRPPTAGRAGAALRLESKLADAVTTSRGPTIVAERRR